MFSRLEKINKYCNKNFTGIDDLWTDRDAVKAIIETSPLHPTEVKLQVDAILNAIDLILTGVLSENYSLTLGFGDMLLMEPEIKQQQKTLLETNLRVLEQWGQSRLGIISNSTLH